MKPGPEMFLYRGSSMWPCFQEGDLLESEPVTPDKLRVGDCIIMQGEDGLAIVHRVIGRRGRLGTRGDAAARVDDHGERTPRVLGRVVGRYRLGTRTTVAGGVAGHLTGLFLRYAGRIDPDRPGRGGRLGRGLRRCCAPLLQPLLRQATRRTLRLRGESAVTVWTKGSIVLALKRDASGEGYVYWPWRLFFRLPGRD